MVWVRPWNMHEKKDVVQECTRDNGLKTCIQKSVNNNELWTLWLDREKGSKYIVLFVLNKQDSSWCYRAIPEEKHPLYWNCPLKYLSEAPVQREAWRVRVREYHRARRERTLMLKSVCVGSFVKLEDGKVLKVSSMKPLLGKNKNGDYHKIMKTKILRVKA